MSAVLDKKQEKNLSPEEMENLAESYKQKAAEIRQAKRKEEINVLIAAIQKNNFQPEELFPSLLTKTGRMKRGKARVKHTAPPKYRSADGTMTWTGVGRRPGWIVEALDKGKKLESFLIKE